MISRRNIRVKVMQTLYTLESLQEEQDGKIGIPLLNEKLNRALDLFIISILYVLRTAEYSETSSQKRAAKYLTTEEDLNVSIKIAANDFLLSLMNNKSFAEKIKEPLIYKHIDEAWVKKIFVSLAQTQEYKDYVSLKDRNPKAEKAIIRFIWEKQMLENEGLMEFFMDELPGWEDDREMILMLMENFFRNNTRLNFKELISAEKKEYAQELLKTVLEKESYCKELIQPKLINWDAERVALIDSLLLRMGVCELLFFPTIPTKVTINEYIDIAKIYSTPQSGQFVNGVLDNILKDLEKENKIRKQDRIRKS